ncbi:IclR family transcriptional regulator [Devosia sp. YIM 151766]|uniref:IclR family transcriptional regulator n=1 Tax=Devosia sp. YIM 151766 TaxID=3017325 RepID=UPI00255C8508|nr:IclR family transcriptional regulator [Devosia sp. YIM 151766]WIY52387.1 IclR family transcriptional regulator [Devosia sp. YIM 151766]
MQEEDRHVQALVAALSLLDAFDDDVGLQLKDFHTRTGLNRSRILRFAGTLKACGYLYVDPVTNAYHLGPRLQAIAWMLQKSRGRFLAVVRPALRDLAGATGDTAFFSSIHNGLRLVVAREESSEGLRFVVDEGQTRPLHVGASSRVLLAFAPSAYRERILAQLTEESSDQIEALLAELESIRRIGFSVSRGEVTAHGFAIAVPVENETDFPDVITLAGPLTKLTDVLIEKYVDRLKIASASLTDAVARFSGSKIPPTLNEHQGASSR